jgi:hypothetical protein
MRQRGGAEFHPWFGWNFMTFTIDVDNNITVLASSQQIEEREEGTETFSNPQELAALAAKWPGARLVEIWNSLPGVEPVERFTSRQVAATRIWKAIQHLQPSVGARRRQAAPKKVSARTKANRRARSARENTKTAKVIALLQQPEGATLRAIMRATGWQTHSVRGFVSGQLKKKLGLKVRSSQRDGERVYSIKR